MKKIWPFGFYFLLFAAHASMGPFIVLYYQGLGFSGTQIGLLTGITPLITLIGAPLWTGLADSTRRHRLIMSGVMLVGITVLALFPFLRAFGTIFLAGFLINIFFAPVSPLADSATMFMLAEEKDKYGRVRVGGTIGFGSAALVAGLIVEQYGIASAFWVAALLFFLALLFSQKFIYNPENGGASIWRSMGQLLIKRRWVLFLTLALAGGIGMAAFNNFLFLYMKELGAAESIMGLALTVGTLSEIPVLFFGDRLLKKFNSYGLLLLAMVITGVRFLLFGVITAPILVLAAQLLNGLAFPAMWLAGVAYANENAPPGLESSAQGLFGAMVFGIGNAMGGFSGGMLLDILDGSQLYIFFGVVIMATVTLVALLHRRSPAVQPTPTGP